MSITPSCGKLYLRRDSTASSCTDPVDRMEWLTYEVGGLVVAGVCISVEFLLITSTAESVCNMVFEFPQDLSKTLRIRQMNANYAIEGFFLLFFAKKG